MAVSCRQSRLRLAGNSASRKAAQYPPLPPGRPKPQFFEGFSSNAILTQSPSIGKRTFRIQKNMPSDEPNPSSTGPLAAAAIISSVTVIVPARNEEAVIAACIASLANQPEIAEILVVNDQSTDGTASVVSGLTEKIPNLRLLESGGLPDGWVGKNHALWVGVQQAKCGWLLFTDADAEHERDSVSRALQIANKQGAALVSLSPEKFTETWYEKALIPFIYLRLARRFSYENGNDPSSTAASANGQFLIMRRDVSDAIGGHSAVAGEVLEDVALALRVKAAGHRIWFGSGNGVVRVRMYRSFPAMWQGWKKNLYRLMGGTPWAVIRRMGSNRPSIPRPSIAAWPNAPFA